MTAHRVNATEFGNCSFFKIFARCVSAVLTLMPSLIAISLLVLASATKIIISRSLLVIESRGSVFSDFSESSSSRITFAASELK